MSTMLSSSNKLRRPNFSSSRGGGSIGGARTGGHLLANYTRQCQKRLQSSSRTFGNDDDVAHHEDGINDGDDVIHNTAAAATEGGADSGSNTTEKKNNNNDPSMEQCIVLLEPSLKIFQSSCVKNDKKKKKARAKRSKKNGGENNNNNALDNYALEQEEDNDDDDDDEVPPQLLRVVRFFHYRWLPMKRALLRPPPSLSPASSSGKGEEESCTVEVSIHYRLRLARACWKKGLVAAAEYESLRRSFDLASSVSNKEKKRKSAVLQDGGEEEDYYNFSKRGNESTTLMERVRLSLMRLPTEAIQPGRSSMAWRHAREMILECCSRWGEEEKKRCDDDNNGSNRSSLEAAEGGELKMVSPSQLADWALTSWTALLLSHGGMECVDDPASFMAHCHNGNSISSLSSVEKHLAYLLSDRSQSSSTANNPTLALARAVECRINNLLSPNNLTLLNGIHLYSLGRLLASFRSSDDAEMHIVTSVMQCSAVGGGGSGMTGLEQLSRLLAVYSSCCCTFADSLAVADRGGLDPIGNGSSNNKDALLSHCKTKSTAAKDLERRLYTKLGKSEFCRKSVISENGQNNSGVMQKQSKSLERAKSFLEAVICATAHLLKCSQKDG